MRCITAVLLAIASTAAFGAGPDTGWGTLLVGGSLLILALLTWVAIWIGRAIFPMSTWKIAVVASVPLLVLIVLPSLRTQAFVWSHRALEQSWANASMSYVAASCHAATSRPLTVPRDASFGILVVPSPKIDLANSTIDVDGGRIQI